MKKFHIAISTTDLEKSIEEYSHRLECKPCIVIKSEYALWRTNTLNFSIRRTSRENGENNIVRHVGWEDPSALHFTKDNDINGLIWENFNYEGQLDEIYSTWPEAKLF